MFGMVSKLLGEESALRFCLNTLSEMAAEASFQFPIMNICYMSDLIFRAATYLKREKFYVWHISILI